MAEAIAYTTLGGPDVLTVIAVPDPEAAPGTLVVDVEAVGVNPIDAKLRSGLRPSPPIAEPRRLGSDASGVVTAVGEGAEGFRVGDPVVIAGVSDAYSTRISVPSVKAWPRPAGVSAAQGAALGVPVGTAYQALRSLAVGPGDTLLVHAGSGAVGQAAIQLARLWGAEVIATSSPARFDRLRELGATPVAYGPGVEYRLRAAAPGGITVALDAAGTDEAILASLALVDDRDRIATIVRGADAAGFGIRAFMGGSPRPLTDREQAWRAEAVPVVLALLAAGSFSVEIAEELPLREAAEAHRMLAAGVHGKLVLVP